MKLKKLLAILVACAMMSSLGIVTASAVITPGKFTVLEFTPNSADMWTATLAASDNNPINNIQPAGSFTRAYEAGKGLAISGRTQDWHAIDLTSTDLLPGDYVLEVKITSASATHHLIQNHGAGGNWFASAENTTESSLIGRFTILENGDFQYNRTNGGEQRTVTGDGYGPARLRISVGGTTSFNILSIKITTDDESLIPSKFDCDECEDSGAWCDECNPEPDCLECEDSGAWCDECNPEPQLPDEKVDITLNPGGMAGAFIDTANLVEGETYHLRVAFKLGNGGNGGIRVRYQPNFGDDFSGDGPYNDGGDANKNPAAHIKGNLFKAGGIPAHIPGNTLANGSAIVLDIDFVFGGGLDNMDNTEFITVLGMWGTGDYEVTGVIITNSDRLVIGMAGDQPMDDAGANVFPPADDGDDADGAGGGDSGGTTSGGGGSGGGGTGTGGGGSGAGGTDDSDDDDKADAPTGAASVAIVAGLATLAAATVVIARRRK